MEIPVHKVRFVTLAALDAYEKTLARAKKANEDAHCSNRDVDEKLVILEHLKASYQDVNGELGLNGTPLAGEAMTAAHYTDDDGTDLRADALDEWLRRSAGCYVPIAVIAEWVLEKRKLVAAWLRGIEKNWTDAQRVMMDALVVSEAGQKIINAGDHPVLDQADITASLDDAQRIGRTCAPDFIDVAWFTPPTPIEAPKLADADVDRWINNGPWGVSDYAENPEPTEGSTLPSPGTEWELVKRDGTDAASIVERSNFVYTGDTALADARHEAAVRNRNLFEAAESAADQPAASLSDEPAELHPV